VVLAGQVGVAGHLKIGHHVVAAGQTGVVTNISDGQKVWGIPAQPIQDIKRQMVALKHLPELLKRVAELEKKSGVERKQDAE
jgi:UDP-3-O-[3-hydroxymyristoyl] glucosamine N-acyltransferase